MSVNKFEPIAVYTVTRSADAFSDNTETLAFAFTTVGFFRDIKNPLKLKEFYRQYTNFLDIVVNYTPAMYNIAQSNGGYSFNSRGRDLRIIDAIENGRESITFLCYDANQTVAV